MFFLGRRKSTVTFAIVTVLSMLLVVLVSGAFWVTGRSATAEGLAASLVSNPQVRHDIADRILTQISDGADAKTRFVISALRTEISNALADQLADPAIRSELRKDVRAGYHFLVSNDKSATIDLRPLLPPLLAAMSKIDPRLKDVKKFLKDIKPINLTKDSSTPDIGKWLNMLKAVLAGLIVLMLLSILLLFRYAASMRSALKITGIGMFAAGVFAVALFFGGVFAATAAANKAADPTATAVVPVAARLVLSYFRNLGLALVAAGLVSVLASFGVSSRSA